MYLEVSLMEQYFIILKSEMENEICWMFSFLKAEAIWGLAW